MKKIERKMNFTVQLFVLYTLIIFIEKALKKYLNQLDLPFLE